MPESHLAARGRGARGITSDKRFWLALALPVVFFGLLAWGFRLSAGSPEPAGRAPEATAVLRSQAGLPFQVLIPGYLPPGFDRARADVRVSRTSEEARPAMQIRYQDREAGAALFVREWLPISPTLETLVGSKPIETKWGRGYLLADQRSGHSTIWADVGGLRVALDSAEREPVSVETALAIVNSLGPPANLQVTSLMAQKPAIREAAPPQPVEARLNKEGTQEITLVATSAGYSPARFAVRKGIPVRLTFRMLADAACASELVFPASPAQPAELSLSSIQEQKTLDFLPLEAGDFVFHCAHNIYRGVVSVR